MYANNLLKNRLANLSDHVPNLEKKIIVKSKQSCTDNLKNKSFTFSYPNLNDHVPNNSQI